MSKDLSLKNSNRVSIWKAIYREITKKPGVLISFLLLTCIVLFVFIASMFIDIEELYKVRLTYKFLPPMSRVGDDLFILGTTEGGLDVFKLLIVGAKNSIYIGWSVALISGFIGISVGIISGYYGGRTDNFIMRVIDFLVVIPALMFQIVLITMLKEYTVFKFIWILILFQWLRYVRILRAKSLQESAQEYVLASKVLGTPTYKIILREMLPNLMSIVLLRMTLAIALSIGIETGLTFLGYGLPTKTPSLGTLVAYAKDTKVMDNYWWNWMPATILILILMLSINAVGQALKRAFDSRQRI